ncbi:MAG: EamA family transporter, partial [Deltaproteobacteria bacterium]|nr:EamA family transporter [Deltaproteobacteria bacterium]
TKAANAVVILSAAPLFAALFSLWFLKERCPPRTWAAIFVCMGGVIWVMQVSFIGKTSIWLFIFFNHCSLVGWCIFI